MNGTTTNGAPNGAPNGASTPNGANGLLDPTAQHLLYVLLDSNLPTGGFVASSGLESYAKHGFLRPRAAEPYAPGQTSAVGTAELAAPSSAAAMGPSKAGPALVGFADAEVENYAASTGFYVARGWGIVREFGASASGASSEAVDAGVDALVALDKAHEATLLSHVARRASKAQGIATLSLYFRGLSAPPGFEGASDGAVRDLVDGYRNRIRRGLAPGHLAVCWGVITAALGMDLGE